MDNSTYNSIFKLGTTGVDLFFIISGFVIFMSIQKISTGIEFVINRISRLYPTYWACVTFTFTLIIFHSLYKGTFQAKEAFIQYIGNLSMFQFYLLIKNIDGPYWTMIIEMIFYIFILLLFELKLLKQLKPIGIFICAVTVLAAHYLYDIEIIKSIITWIPLLQFFPLFFAGIIFYKIYTNKTNLTINYVLIIFCLVCQLLLFHIGRSKVFISLEEYGFMLILYFLLFTLFANNKLSFIVNGITLFLGKISFALYLIHQRISLSFIIPLFHEKLGINFWIVTVFIDLPIIIAIAAFITYKIEIPYSRKMKEKLRTLLIKKNP
jgi:peptidoglycan/LPS O-acetylase OafA/YrhL